MSENLIGSFFYSFQGGAVYKLQKSKLEETIKPEQKKSDFKIIVTGLDRERIKIGTDFTPYFVRFGNFNHYVAHHYKIFIHDAPDWPYRLVIIQHFTHFINYTGAI